MAQAQIAGLTSREPEMTLEEMMPAIGDSLRDLACSDNGEDGEDEDEETEQGKRCADNEPRCVMDTISKTVPQCMESFQLKLAKLDEFTQPGREDAAHYVRQRDTKYGRAELTVPVVGEP
jgi:hypothetical protein